MKPRRRPLTDFLERCWYGGSRWSIGLLPLALLYGAVVGVRRWLYRTGFLAIPELSLPVVVVGNITVGGTGKSPVVAWLARELASRGRRPGIVSRGYGGRASATPRVVPPDGDPAEYGDEPVMLARQTGLPVVVATDRVAAVRHLQARFDVDVVIADDGLQHYRLARVMELVVVDGMRGLGNLRLLPAGPLRESSSRLSGADRVLVNGHPQAATVPSEALSFALKPANMRSLDNAASRSLDAFAGQRVWAVAGIGNPQRFYDLLGEAGIRVDSVPVPDHGTCSLDGLQAERDQPILMTEKDAIKYRHVRGPDVWYLPVSVEFDAGQAEALVQQVLVAIGASPKSERAASNVRV